MKKILLSSLLLAMTIVTSAQEVSKDLIKKAKGGDIEAQFNLGKAYIESSDNVQAAKWLYSAAKSGNKDAENLLFTFYSKELEKYAKEGNADAQYHLGLCYLNGSGVNTDKEKAATLFDSAMQQGQEEAGQAFFSFESKLKSMRVRTLCVNSMMIYTGYATPDKSTGYNIEKSPVAEVCIGEVSADKSRMQEEYVNIKGKKDGDKFMNATLTSERMGITYEGDLIVQSVSEMNPATRKYTKLNTKITFLPGGKLLMGYNSEKKKYTGGWSLDENFSILIDRLNEYGVFNMEGEITSIRKGVTYPSKTVSNIINDDIKNRYTQAIEFIGVDSTTFDLETTLQINARNGHVYNTYSLSSDTLHIGNYIYYPQNGKVVLADMNEGNIIIWDDNVEVFKKVYKDGIINYNVSSESNISFFNKEKFKGTFYLGSLKPQYNSLSNLKEVWLGERISDFPFTIYEGDYTDEKGNIEHWVKGFPEKAYEEFRAKVDQMNEDRLRAHIQGLKRKRDEAKKTLIDEGFAKEDVETLLDKCVIKKGMTLRLIQRAHELNSNLFIEMNCELDGRPRHLIQITDANTGELMFYAFVGYCQIFLEPTKVCIIEAP